MIVFDDSKAIVVSRNEEYLVSTKHRDFECKVIKNKASLLNLLRTETSFGNIEELISTLERFTVPRDKLHLIINSSLATSKVGNETLMIKFRVKCKYDEEICKICDKCSKDIKVLWIRTSDTYVDGELIDAENIKAWLDMLIEIAKNSVKTRRFQHVEKPVNDSWKKDFGLEWIVPIHKFRNLDIKIGGKIVRITGVDDIELNVYLSGAIDEVSPASILFIIALMSWKANLIHGDLFLGTYKKWRHKHINEIYEMLEIEPMYIDKIVEHPDLFNAWKRAMVKMR